MNMTLTAICSAPGTDWVMRSGGYGNPQPGERRHREGRQAGRRAIT